MACLVGMADGLTEFYITSCANRYRDGKKVLECVVLQAKGSSYSDIPVSFIHAGETLPKIIKREFSEAELKKLGVR